MAQATRLALFSNPTHQQLEGIRLGIRPWKSRQEMVEEIRLGGIDVQRVDGLLG